MKMLGLAPPTIRMNKQQIEDAIRDALDVVDPQNERIRFNLRMALDTMEYERKAGERTPRP